MKKIWFVSTEELLEASYSRVLKEWERVGLTHSVVSGGLVIQPLEGDMDDDIIRPLIAGVLSRIRELRGWEKKAGELAGEYRELIDRQDKELTYNGIHRVSFLSGTMIDLEDMAEGELDEQTPEAYETLLKEGAEELERLKAEYEFALRYEKEEVEKNLNKKQAQAIHYRAIDILKAEIDKLLTMSNRERMDFLLEKGVPLEELRKMVE